MGPHSRKSSRGSFSLFSIPSLSRAGSRQAYRNMGEQASVRPESSLSYTCDPSRQPPGSPGPYLPMTMPSAAPETPDLGALSPRQLSKLNLIPGPSHADKSCSNNFKKTRHLSWLPFLDSTDRPLHTRSLSMHLPTGKSCVSMCPSNISAPILTSTTNPRVACDEGVPQGELDYQVLGFQSVPTQRDHIEQISNPSGNTRTGGDTLARKIGSVVGDPEESIGCVDKPVEAHKNSIHRLRVSWRKLLHKRPANSLKSSGISTSSLQEVEHKVSPGLSQSFAQRHAETLNLGRHKIRRLTGQAHIRKRSVNDFGVFYNKILPEARSANVDPPLLQDTDFTGHYLDPVDNGSAFSSLTKSFASAVDKLDREAAATDMSFLRSKSSFFNPKRDAPAPPATTSSEPPSHPAAPRSAIVPFRISSQDLPKEHPDYAKELSKHDVGSPLTGYGARELGSTTFGATYGRGIRTSDPQPMTFTGEHSKPYVPTAPSDLYPRGIRALGMHTNTMAFAAPPDNVKDLARPQMSTGRRDVDDNVRSTPSDRENRRHRLLDTVNTPQGIEGHGEYRKLRGDQEMHTPTKRGGLRHGLTNSKSGFSLFGRSKVPAVVRMPPEALKDTERMPLKAARVLHDRDRNKKVETQQVKKSRSMNFMGLLQKTKDPEPIPALPTMPETPHEMNLPHQPTTPSPLHQMLRARPKTSGSPQSDASLVASGPWTSPRRTRDVPSKRQGGFIAQMPGWTGDAHGVEESSEDGHDFA